MRASRSWAEAGDAPDLLRKVAAHKPDIAIVDVQMPPDNTDDGLRAAMGDPPHPTGRRRARAFSQYAEERYAVDLIGGDAEGVGYLLKDRVTDFKLFADAVAARRGRRCRCSTPPSSSHMLSHRRRDDPLAALTPRERAVLELMAEGRSKQGHRRGAGRHGRTRSRSTSRASSPNSASAPGPEDHRRVLAVLALHPGGGESARG